jgi:hypothetical protein
LVALINYRPVNQIEIVSHKKEKKENGIEKAERNDGTMAVRMQFISER